MFPPRKVSDIFNSVTEALRLSYGVAAWQKCTVQANKGFLSASRPPAQPSRALLRAGGWFCSQPQDSLAQWDCWPLGQLPSWECGATKPPLQLEEFPNLQQKVTALTKHQAELGALMCCDSKCSSEPTCAAVLLFQSQTDN